ncbi:MAG: hypothetical protein ABMA15_25680 [Vicinamibacterales bacterium]
MLDALPPSVLCLRCAALHHRGATPLVCPVCGFEISPTDYSAIERYAREAAYFGYLYRQQFEKDFAKNPESEIRYYLVPPGEILTYLALVAVSGIIGGASWDLCKLAFQRIRARLSPTDDERESTLRSELRGEAVDQFFEYMRDYHAGRLGSSNEVAAAVREERLAHRLTERVTPLLRAPMPDGVDPEKFIADAIGKIEDPPRPQPEDLRNCWSEIESSDDEQKEE